MTISTNQMFWPIIIKLTSLLVRFCGRARAAGRERASPACEPLPLALLR